MTIPDFIKIFEPKKTFQWFVEIFEFYFLPRKFFRNLFQKPDTEKLSQVAFYLFASCAIITTICLFTGQASLPYSLWIMFKQSAVHILDLFLIFLVVYVGNSGNAKVSLANIILFVITVLSLFDPWRVYFYSQFLQSENYNDYLVSNIFVATEAFFITVLGCFIFYDRLRTQLLKLFLLWFFANISGAVRNSVTNSTGDHVYTQGPEPVYSEFLFVMRNLQRPDMVFVPYDFLGKQYYGLVDNGTPTKDSMEYKNFNEYVNYDIKILEIAIDSARFLRNKEALFKRKQYNLALKSYFDAGRITLTVNDSEAFFAPVNEPTTELFTNLYNDAVMQDAEYRSIVGKSTYPLFYFNYYYCVRRKLNGEVVYWNPFKVQTINTTDKLPENWREYH